MLHQHEATNKQPKEIRMNIPTTENEAFMWSEALCGVRGNTLAASVRS